MSIAASGISGLAKNRQRLSAGFMSRLYTGYYIERAGCIMDVQIFGTIMRGVNYSYSRNAWNSDNGGRRSGIDRRCYSYARHIPERRNGFDRRKLENRRQKVKVIEFGSGQHGSERRKAWKFYLDTPPETCIKKSSRQR